MSRVVLHLLGAGDLGVAPTEYPATLEKLAAAAERGDHDLRDRLLTATRSEAHHRRHPLAGLGDLADEPDGIVLVLVATEQSPPRSGDTVGLARVLADLTDDEFGALYGWRPACRLPLVLGGIGLDEVKRGVLDHAGDWKVADERPDRMILDVSTGGVAFLVGLVLGLVESGRSAKLELHEAKAPDGKAVTTIGGVRILHRALMRTRMFDDLAGLLGAKLTDTRDPAEQRHLHDQISLLRTRAVRLRGLSPPMTEDWAEHRRIIEDCLTTNADNGDPLARNYYRPWLLASVRERDPERVQDRNDGEIGAGLNGTEKKMWHQGATADHQLTLAADPETYRRQARNYLPAERIAESGARTFEGIDGCPPWPAVRGEGRVTLLPVGRSAGEAAVAIADAIAPGSRDRAVLVATEDTRDQAHSLRSLIPVPTDVIEVPNVAIRAAEELITARFRDHPAMVAAGSVAVVTAPGTHAMNLGALAAGLALSADHVVPLHVGALVRVEDGSRVEWAEGRVLQRLGPDPIVAFVVDCALQDLQLGLAVRLCREVGSSRFDQLATGIESFQARLLGHPHEPRSWRARLTCLTRIVDKDPWRAVYWAGRLGDATFGYQTGWNNSPGCRALYDLGAQRGPLGHGRPGPPPAWVRVHSHAGQRQLGLAELIAEAALEKAAPGGDPADLLVRGLDELIEAARRLQ